MNKLIIIEILLLFFILTSCFDTTTKTGCNATEYIQNDSVKKILESVYISIPKNDHKIKLQLILNANEFPIHNDSVITAVVLKKAQIFNDLRMKDSARIWFNTALVLLESEKDKSFIYNKLGELSDDSDSITAEEYFNKSLEMYPNKQARLNLAKINLMQTDSSAVEIFAVQDSVINSLKTENQRFASLQYSKNKNTNAGFWIAALFLVLILFLFQKQNRLKKENVVLKKQLQTALIHSSNGEKLYNQALNNKPIASWTTDDMVNFIEYYRTLKPEFVESLDQNYKKLSPRYKIILVLEDMGKSVEEIKLIMSFEATSYFSAKSRINSAKK